MVDVSMFIYPTRVSVTFVTSFLGVYIYFYNLTKFILFVLDMPYKLPRNFCPSKHVTNVTPPANP